MQILTEKTDDELHRSLLAELAKATNEIRCARQDVDKAQSRLTFALACVHELIDRQGDR